VDELFGCHRAAQASLQTGFRTRIVFADERHACMKRQLIFGLAIAVLAVNLLLGARLYTTSAQAAQKDSPYPNLKLFSQVMEKVRRDYVDGQNLSYQDLVYSALKGMINKLDPHSEFLDPERYRELQSDTEGHFGGLGIVIATKDNFVTVIAPMEDTPGFRAGILSGDRIVKIDGKSAEAMNLQDAVKLLRGDPGTDVTVTILRPSSGQVKDYKLTRAIINVDMVKDINGKKEFPLGDSKIGYVRLVQFGEKTSEGLEAALQKLKAQGMKAFILDLRWNPGGLLDQAVEVSEKFLPRGQLVVTTEGRNASQNSERRAEGRGDELVDRSGAPLPMVVLVNPWSASASEIVSGCLQDLHRAILVGERTFGKGSVQSIIGLDDGSALRLTTAKYYTPSHKVIHEVGITPNVVVPISDEDDRDLQLKRTPGGIESLDEKGRVRVASVQDVQLERATDLLKGILLFTERSGGEAGGSAGKLAAMSAVAK
jgi:carboxyl-terminal processing protease